jgi:hypothetical protein
VASIPVLAHAVLDRLGSLDGDDSVEAIDTDRELHRLIAVPEIVNESVQRIRSTNPFNESLPEPPMPNDVFPLASPDS